MLETVLGGNELLVVVLDCAITFSNSFARDFKLGIGSVPSDKVVLGTRFGDPLYVLCLDGSSAGGARGTVEGP